MDKYRAEIIRLAKKAEVAGEVPVGAIVVGSGGEILGRGYNKTHQTKDGLQHAELVAIRQAQKKMGDWRLTGTKLWVTLEPCLMCLGAMGNARVSEVVYILADPLFGSVDSKLTKAQRRKIFPKMECRKLRDDGEIAEMMGRFFKSLRKG